MWALCTSGCATTTSPKHSHPAAAPAPSQFDAHITTSPPPLVEVAWRAYTLPSHSVRVYLPEGEHWRSHADGTFWRAEHNATHSSLLLKRWREGRLVDARDCEQQALLWKPQFERPRAGIAEGFRLRTLDSYHSEAAMYLVDDVRAGVTHGTLIAHGASFRDCFSFLFSTQANISPQSTQVVRARLDVMSRALRRIERQRAADRVGVPRRPAP